MDIYIEKRRIDTISKTLNIDKLRNERLYTQYKTAGVQWFNCICSIINFLQRWVQTPSENPTVSYCQTLSVVLKKETSTV
jgi:hypothetical protein